MALVRCPTHKIPYNDENPRGCPACAREREGGGEAVIMQELARATQRGETVATKPDGRDTAPAPRSIPSPFRPHVTTQPKTPAPEANRIEELLWQLGRPRTIVIGAISIVVLGTLLVLSTGPEYVTEPHPIVYAGEVRPLPVEPNTPIAAVFAVLGTRAPEAHPTAPSLARYSYGSDLVVDALNAQVYALTFSVPNRSWSGLRVGVSRMNAEGALALLATPEDRGVSGGAPPQPISGYTVYPSLDSLPTLTLVAAVRPPNGCYDVQVELNPQVSGILIDGDRRHAVIGSEGAVPRWVVTRVRVVSRRVRGPYGGDVAC